MRTTVFSFQMRIKYLVCRLLRVHLTFLDSFSDAAPEIITIFVDLMACSSYCILSGGFYNIKYSVYRQCSYMLRIFDISCADGADKVLDFF